MISLIERYRDRLPVTANTPQVSLGEGDTPLIPADRLSGIVDRPVWLKVEGANPTGSFKDRGMSLAVSKALEHGARAVACASTGNTAASAAAYAARAGLECVVVLPAGKVALGKLSQAVRHGAQIVAVDGSFDAALEAVRDLAETHEVTLVNSVNPYRIAGQQTVSWEVLEQLGEAPAIHALPVGNAGNITAHWLGYRHAGASPQMWGFQAAGAAPLVEGAPVENPVTVATAIRIGNPASWNGAVTARVESDGLIAAVTDQQILDAYDFLASREGVFVEPASAAGVAGIIARKHDLRRGPVVVTLTGHGLKDPEIAVSGAELGDPVEPTAKAVADALGW